MVETPKSPYGLPLPKHYTRTIQTTSGQEVPIAQAQNSGYSRHAVWEIDLGTPLSRCALRLVVRAYFVRTTRPLGPVICRLSFAPLSSNTLPSSTSPVPRFAEFGPGFSITLEHSDSQL
jgi:hypothetical protein